MSLNQNTDLDIYLTGATSDGQKQDDPEQSTGNHRSSVLALSDSMENAYPVVANSYTNADDNWYIALAMKNNHATDTAVEIMFYLFEDGSTTISDDYGTGAITITVADGSIFNDSCGWIKNTTQNEVCYFTSRTANTITITAAGRGSRGTSETTWSNGDTVIPWPWCDICLEVNPSNKTSGAMQSIADIYTAFTLGANTSGTWYTPVYSTNADGYTNGLDIDINGYGTDLQSGYIVYILFKMWIGEGMTRNLAAQLNKLRWGANV
jgi:hypothetical protein